MRARCWQRREAALAASVARLWRAPLALQWRRRRAPAGVASRAGSFRTTIVQCRHHHQTTLALGVNHHWYHRVAGTVGVRALWQDRLVRAHDMPIAVGRSAAQTGTLATAVARGWVGLAWRIVSRRRGTGPVRRAAKARSPLATRWRERTARALATFAVVAAPSPVPVRRGSDAIGRSPSVPSTRIPAGGTTTRQEHRLPPARQLARPASQPDEHKVQPEKGPSPAVTGAPAMRLRSAAVSALTGNRTRFDRPPAGSVIGVRRRLPREGMRTDRGTEASATPLVSRAGRATRATTPSDRTDHLTGRGVTRRAPFHEQAPPLVWRKTAAPVDRAHPDAGSSRRTAARSERAVASAEQRAASHQAAARSASAAPHLDPALLDRLAEDVMQRLDRRLRIERERRGL